MDIDKTAKHWTLRHNGEAAIVAAVLPGLIPIEILLKISNISFTAAQLLSDNAFFIDENGVKYMNGPFDIMQGGGPFAEPTPAEEQEILAMTDAQIEAQWDENELTPAERAGCREQIQQCRSGELRRRINAEQAAL
ncbi:MAG: hypothetical protein DRP56_07150 [Planctomycetota bacterium]|nr:MAG: hypothetical protein DRP56_07150 [Planctomycetota bacterium]